MYTNSMRTKGLVSTVLTDRLLIAGVVLLAVGTGPLLVVILFDPAANPVGPGLLAFLTFWPAVMLTLVGLVRGSVLAARGVSEGPEAKRRP